MEASVARVSFYLLLGILSSFLLINIISSILEDLIMPFEIKMFEKIFKSEYNKYNAYIFNEESLDLTISKHLDIYVYSEGFKNNTELRRDFMQIAYTLRRLNYMAEKDLDEEVEDMFAKIRQFAYSNDEPICESDLYPEDFILEATTQQKGNP